MGLFFSKNRSAIVPVTLEQFQQYNETIEQLQRENSALQQINKGLEDRISSLLVENTPVGGANRSVSNIQNNKQVLEFIEQILQDPSCNIKYLPDAIERHMYRTVLQSVVSLLDKVISGTHIQLLGHQMSFSLAPSSSMPTSISPASSNSIPPDRVSEISSDDVEQQ